MVRASARIAALLVTLFVGCVGDAPTATDGGARAGEEGGPCYSDGTCNKNLGLTCASNLCVRVGSDAGGADAKVDAADGAADGAAACDFPVAPAAGIVCDSTVCAVTKCCYLGTSGACVAISNSCTNGISLQCDDKADCSGTDVCCLTANVIEPNACPVQLAGTTASSCAASCNGGLVLCGKGEACGGGKRCVQAEIPGVHVYGVCL
jgi:hypothetical protein